MRVWYRTLLLLLTINFLPQLTTAEDGEIEQGWEFGGGLIIANANKNVKGGLGVNIYFDYMPSSPFFMFRTSFGTYRADTKVNKLSRGNYSLMWIEQSMCIHNRQEKPAILPYIGAGIGRYLIDQQIAGDIEAAFRLLGFRIEETIDNTVGLHLRGGIKMKVGRRTFLNLDIKHIFIKPYAKATLTNLSTFQSDSIEDEIDLGTLFVGFGIIIKFE